MRGKPVFRSSAPFSRFIIPSAPRKVKKIARKSFFCIEVTATFLSKPVLLSSGQAEHTEILLDKTPDLCYNYGVNT